MRPYLLILALLSLLAATASPAQDKSFTWIAAPARGQLERDPTLIPRGKGFLFVPAMTSALNEPSYRVFQGKGEVAQTKPGTGVTLSPGYYEVFIGSGSIAQMMSRTVEVREGMTTLMKPFWSGLVIDVIDATRTSINESYELYWQDQQENYGIGFGIEEERGETVRTWLLPPGVYTVLSVGDNISTTRRFSVRLEPGELILRNLVLDTGNLSFIGFYPPTLQGLLGQSRTSHWKATWELSGSTQFSTSQNTTGEDLSVFSLSTQVFGRATYSTDNTFANLRLIFEEGFARREGDAFRKSIDEFEVRSTYIYRGFSKRFGPYLRGVVTTKFFATEARFDQQSRLYQIDDVGDTTQVLNDVGKFTLSPALSPLEFRQGIGINSQLVNSFPLNLAMRIGFGARQNYVVDTFDLNADRTVAREIKSATSAGLEALLVLDSRLARVVSLDSEFDLLIPGIDSKAWEFTWKNRWRILLSRFVNLDIVVDFERLKPLNRLQSEQQALLRFVYLL